MALSGQSGLAEGRRFAWGTARPPPTLPPHSLGLPGRLLVKLQPAQKDGLAPDGASSSAPWCVCVTARVGTDVGVYRAHVQSPSKHSLRLPSARVIISKAQMGHSSWLRGAPQVAP